VEHALVKDVVARLERYLPTELQIAIVQISPYKENAITVCGKIIYVKIQHLVALEVFAVNKSFSQIATNSHVVVQLVVLQTIADIIQIY